MAFKLHPNAADITGEKRNRLVALRPLRSKNQGVVWLFKCGCGNTTEICVRNFRSGAVKSCGCLKSEKTKARRTKKLAGKRFGRLVALYPSDQRVDGRVVWICKCDCGKVSAVCSSNLISGACKSCGCYRVDRTLEINSEREYPSGKDHPNWTGGFSRDGYAGFTEAFKDSIRERDNRTCQLCDVLEEEIGRALSVHHIDYDKANSVPENCTSLCPSCHTKTNFNRKQWIKRFT